MKIQMFKNEKPGFHSPLATEVPKRISNMLAQMSEIYLIVARRNMSEAAIEINPMSLIACDPFETSAMSSSQILLDALPPSFRSECGQSAHACDRDREEHGSKIMDRLECYYARMCATEILSMNHQVLRSSSIYPSNFGDPNNHTSEPNKLELSFRGFLRSLPIEHAPVDLSRTDGGTAYRRAKANLSSLVRSELRRSEKIIERDSKSNTSTNGNSGS